MNIEFLDVAELEFLETVEYYNSQSEGLGYDFAYEVKRTFERIIQFPEAWPSISKRSRRCRTKRFPYAVIYQIREDVILIVAIMHLSKHPKSWRYRLPRDDS